MYTRTSVSYTTVTSLRVGKCCKRQTSARRSTANSYRHNFTTLQIPVAVHTTRHGHCPLNWIHAWWRSAYKLQHDPTVFFGSHTCTQTGVRQIYSDIYGLEPWTMHTRSCLESISAMQASFVLHPTLVELLMCPISWLTLCPPLINYTIKHFISPIVIPYT